MRKLISIFIAIIISTQTALAGGSAPPSNHSLQQVSAESTSKRLAKKIGDKAQEISRELWEGKRKNVDRSVQDFLVWLKQEVGEAFDMSNDFPNFIIAAKIVFSAACSHDIVEYRKGWSVFLSIVVKYAAAVGCATIEPVFLPYVCLFVGHLVGKYLGDFIGKSIHEHSCTQRDMDFVELSVRSNQFLENFDPYSTVEYRELMMAFGVK